MNKRVAEQFSGTAYIIFSRGNTEGRLRQKRGDVKVQRRNYFSVKRCNEVLPSVTVGDKINLGETGVNVNHLGQIGNAHTQILSNNLTGRTT